MFRGFSLGISSFFDAIGFVFKHRLIHYFLYPILLSITLTILSWVGGFALIQTLVDWLEIRVVGYLPGSEQVGDAPDFGWDWFTHMWDRAKNGLSNGFTWIVAIALKFIFFFITAFLLKYIVLACMSPILALLSEKTEKILTGIDYPFKLDQFVRDVWRGILIAVRNFFIEVFLMIIVWVVFIFLGSIFPPLSILSVIILFGISSYFYGFAMLDYVNERRRIGIRQGSRFIRKYSGLAIALGMFIAVIPEISYWLIQFVASFFISTVAIISVVGAVIALNKEIGLGENKKQLPEWTNDRAIEV